MEDTNKLLKFLTIFKIIIVILLIVALVIIIFSFINHKTADTYFKKAGYEKSTNDIWTKQETKTNNNTYITVTYSYMFKDKQFDKTISSNQKRTQKYIGFSYNNTNNIKITYSFDGIVNNKQCTLVQKGTYNYKTGNFSCNTIINENDCEVHCNEIKKDTEKFAKELIKIKKEAKI